MQELNKNNKGKMMANIIFEIGDYSSDGHNYCAEFMVKMNKTVEEAREIHFVENEFFQNLCSKYLQNYVYVHELYQLLLKRMSHEEAMEFLIKFNNEQEAEILIDNDEKVDLISVVEEDYHTLSIYDPKTMLNLWLMLLKVIDSSVEYEVISVAMSKYYIKYKGYPAQCDGTMNFCGHDKEGRYLYSPGYGIWNTNAESEFCND